MNVLFIMVDDLVKRSVVFQNAYCNVPVSGTSRACLLAGVYPDFSKRRFVGAETFVQKDLPGEITLPQAFKENGYYTVSLGKVFHNHDGCTDSWCEEPRIVTPAGRDWTVYNRWKQWKEEVPESELYPKSRHAGYCEAAATPDSCYEDNIMSRKAMETLRGLKEKRQPFLLAVGFRKPHLPFVAAKKYWGLYKREDIKMADNRYSPKA